MCARYSLTASPRDLEALLEALMPPDLIPRYNIAPTQPVLAVIEDDEGRQARWLKWGLVPSWADDPSIAQKLINARAETAAERSSFKTAFRKRRCLIPASNFFEWLHYDIEDSQEAVAERESGQSAFDFGGEKAAEVVSKKYTGKTSNKTVKQPFLFRRDDGRPFAFAGLWESWRPATGGPPLQTCTILTTEPNELVRPFHNRMPCMLHPDDFDPWLDPDNERPEMLIPLLQPYPTEEMRAYPVTRKMNNALFEEPEAIEPVDLEA